MAESILNGKAILAVDDEADVLSLLEEEILGAALKCRFEKASTYEEAVKKLESQNYDVVILDIRMPERSGIGLLESIKDSNDPPVVIILTNYPYAAYRKRCFELGASHFFDKTTEFDGLEGVVRELASVGN